MWCPLNHNANGSRCICPSAINYKIQQATVDNYPAGARRMKQMI